MNFNEIADGLTACLRLSTPPVALSFVQNAPAATEVLADEVPSTCALWRKAETSVFYAPAEKHFNCPIGAMVMGFDLPQPIHESLMSFVGMMSSSKYIDSDEPASIPTIQSDKKGILYGPLKDFTTEPDLILIWLTPRQAMLFNEGTGNAKWGRTSPLPVFGRPACAALPVAHSSGRSALSLGCAGMRTFTEISDDKLLAAVKGSEAPELLERLRATVDSNDTMQRAYDELKSGFSH